MNSLHRYRVILSLVFISLFSMGNLTIKTSDSLSVKGIILVVIAPFQKLFHGTYRVVGRLWVGLTEINYLRAELEKTRRKLELYENIAQNFDELKKENERLRTLLGYKSKTRFNVIPAEVIAKNPGNFYRIMIINKGSRHGVRKYMPVVAYHNGEKAVLGKIIEVRWNISKVLPIIDAAAKTGALIQRTRHVGLMIGMAPTYGRMVVRYISPHAKLKIGDIVVTSGQGGIYPPGLPLGKVVQIRKTMMNGFKECIAEPYLDFGKIDQVLVINKSVDQDLLELTLDGAEKKGMQSETRENEH